MNTTKFLLVLGLMLSFFQAFSQTSAEIPEGKSFIIQSAQNYGKNPGGCWDIPGGKNPSLNDGKNVEVWDCNGGQDQYFKFTKSSMPGYYEIYVSYNSNYRVNVDGGSSNNSTNIELWSNNSNNRQNFRLKHMGDGRFKIYTTTGRVLCLNGRSSNNGTNIHIWEDHNGPWMEWYLLDPNTRQKYVPSTASNSATNTVANTNASSSVGKTLYTLKSGEELVYGKTGLTDDGDIKYNLAIIRKYNSSKTVYKDEWVEYNFGSQAIQGGANLKVWEDPAEFAKYDFWVVLNGVKMGPYDGIIDLNQVEPRIDKWISDDGKTISFAGQRENQYVMVLHNKEVRKFYSPNSAPIVDKHVANTYFSLGNRGEVIIGKDNAYYSQNWGEVPTIRCTPNGDIYFVGKKNGQYNLYWNLKEIHSGIKFDERSLGARVYYETHKEALRSEDKNDFMVTGNNLLYRVNNNDGTVTVSAGKPGDSGYNKLNFTSDSEVSHIYKINGYYYFLCRHNAKTDFYKYEGSAFNKIFSLDSYYRLFDEKKGHFSAYVNNKIKVIALLSRNAMNVKEYSLMDTEEKKRVFYSPNGDTYTCFMDGKYGVDKFSNVYKNDQQYAVFNKCEDIDEFEFVNSTGEPVITALITGEDRAKGIENDYRLYIGNDVFKSNKWYKILAIAPKGKAVYTTYSNSAIKGRKILCNGEPVSDKEFISINSFCTNEDGSKSAFLTTTASDFMYSHDHTRRSFDLATKHQLVLNGQIQSGHYGTPIYVPKKKEIIVIKQVGDKLIVSNL